MLLPCYVILALSWATQRPAFPSLGHYICKQKQGSEKKWEGALQVLKVEIGERPDDRYQKDKNKWKFEQVIVETTSDSRGAGHHWYYRTVKINMGRGSRVGQGFSCQGKVAKSYHSEINSPEGNPARSYKAVPLDQAATGKPLFFPCTLQL